MAATVEHPLAKAYLERLDRSLSQMDQSQAALLRAQIIDNLNLSLASTKNESDVSVVSDELGPPDAIVAEALRNEALRERSVMSHESLLGAGMKILLSTVTALVLVASLALLVAPLFGASVPPLTLVLAALLFVASLAVLIRLWKRRTRA